MVEAEQKAPVIGGECSCCGTEHHPFMPVVDGLCGDEFCQTGQEGKSAFWDRQRKRREQLI